MAAETRTYPSLELLTGQCWRQASQGSEVLSGLHRKVDSASVPDEEGKKGKAMAHVTWARPACPSKACAVLTSHNPLEMQLSEHLRSTSVGCRGTRLRAGLVRRPAAKAKLSTMF